MANNELMALANLKAEYSNLSREMDFLGGKFYITACEHRTSFFPPKTDTVIHTCKHPRHRSAKPGWSGAPCLIKDCPI